MSAYKPFLPESPSHQRLGPFNWVWALEMLRESVRYTCDAETYAITSKGQRLPVPAFEYETRQTRLMPWILEVSLRYLESPDFDRDTLFISPDTLVFHDLRPYFKDRGDLGVIVRLQEKYEQNPLLNGVQWWSVRGKDRLIAFYRRALEIGESLDEGYLRWGGDTRPLICLLWPLERGYSRRFADIKVNGVDYSKVTNRGKLEDVLPPKGRWPSAAITDFKNQRKEYMHRYFQATYGSLVSAS